MLVRREGRGWVNLSENAPLPRDMPLQDFLAMLGDNGVDVAILKVRIQAQLKAPLDRKAGVKLAKARRPSYTSH